MPDARAKGFVDEGGEVGAYRPLLAADPEPRRPVGLYPCARGKRWYQSLAEPPPSFAGAGDFR